MHGRHIALFAMTSTAHINPFLGLCPELVRRGYRVTIVTDQSLAKRVIEAGAEPVVFEPCRLTVALTAHNVLPASDPRCFEEVGSIVYPWTLNTAALAAWQLNEFYRENRPDLIIYDYGAYAGRILAKRLRSPIIQYYHDFIHHSGYYCGDSRVGKNPQSIAEYSKLLDAVLWAHGLEEPNNFWHTEELNLCPFPKAFQFNAELLDSRRFCFVGPFLDRPFRRMWKNRSGGKRIILVSAITGSLDVRYFNRFVDALTGSEYHVILSVGGHFPISELGALPENFEINTNASHLEILPHTDLHFYSGGVNGTLEGFYFGVPLIALPSFAHNYKIAERLAERGLALNLPLHALTSEMIRDSVESVLRDDAFLERLKETQRVIQNSGGSVIAADRIEEFLAAHS